MAIGVWVSLQLVPGVQAAGASATAAVVSTVAVLATLASGLLLVPVYRVWNRAAARATGQVADQPLLDLPRRELFAPVYRMWALGVVRIGVDAGGALVVVPAAFWLGVSLCHLVGAPVARPVGLAGIGTAVVAGVVTDAVRAACQRATRWLAGPDRMARAARDAAELALVAIGLSLSVWLIGGVQLVPDAAGPGWLALVALAALFTRENVWVSLPRLTLVLMVVITGLKLWLVSWFSQWWEVTLRIDGGWSFLLATLVLVAGTLPSWLPVARSSGVAVHIAS